MDNRGNFSSKLGIILASAGSAVGLGNVWRFPTEVGRNGGAAFILIYVACVLIIGVPLMVSEFIIGRHTHANTADAYRKLAPRSGWVFQGYLGVFTSWFILCYYGVVAGWTLKYLVDALLLNTSAITNSSAFFDEFKSQPLAPLFYMMAVVAMCHLVIVRGVQGGIERSSKLMMPLLFIIMVVLMVCSFFMPGTEKGLTFLFQPDFSRITPDVVLSAMGQAFFSLSIAMGCLCTYASYFTNDSNLTKTAASVAGIDTMVAIMSGIIIFPAVYSVSGLSPDEGSGLVFKTLPYVFNTAFANAPVLGAVFAVLFYLLLLLAALTSMVSIHEPATAFIIEHFHVKRYLATRYVTFSAISIGVLCSLSLGELKDFTPLFGMTFFDFFDFISAKIFLPVGGFIISLFVGWRLKRQLVEAELTNNGSLRFPRPLLIGYIFLLRWVIPIAIVCIFLKELGLL
ncbi:MAG: sodium-dependent transporter [Bacteroidaceae bacterium]|nr:sodium-dependent transporter [Bacteroidaceae bacterium]